MQTNGATKRVSRAVGFQAIPLIDYTLEYVHRNHTAGLCFVYVQPQMDNLITVRERGTLH